MSNEQALVGTATAAQIRARVNRIQEVMLAVMKKDVHFGTIPGTPKPTLYKAGSEVILATFHIAVNPIVDDLSTPDAARYRVACQGLLPSGEIVGVGIGEASSDEEKYRWRRVVCDAEWDATPVDRKRIKWQKKQGQVEEIKQIRTEPADIANTVLKMAKKRAQIDMTLTATAASDVFAQDIEDLPDEVREAVVSDDHAAPTMQAPRAKESGAPQAAKPQPEDDGQEGPGTDGVTVTEYKQRTGETGAGKPWTLHTATFSDGRDATTFDEQIGALLAKAHDNKMLLHVVCEPSKRDAKKLTITEAEVA